jgi:8-oxo-dGTP pyrophosphatase MutT (NUDIX family)
MFDIVIKPKRNQRIVPLPKGTKVVIDGGKKLIEYPITYSQKLTLIELENRFKGTNGVVTPVTFDTEVSRERIVVRDGKITGQLQSACYLLKKYRGQDGLPIVQFTNEPRLVGVKRGMVDNWQDHLYFGVGGPDTRYWVLEIRGRDNLLTIPGGFLDGEHAQAKTPLDANGEAELWEETGIRPDQVTGSIQFASFEGDMGDVNWVWCGDGDSSLTISKVISGFGPKQREETRCLVFVAQTNRGMEELSKSNWKLWPNLVELLERDYIRLNRG